MSNNVGGAGEFPYSPEMHDPLREASRNDIPAPAEQSAPGASDVQFTGAQGWYDSPSGTQSIQATTILQEIEQLEQQLAAKKQALLTTIPRFE